MKINFLSLVYPRIHRYDLLIRSKIFDIKLKIVARFIMKHKLYPVLLTKELLDIWEKRW